MSKEINLISLAVNAVTVDHSITIDFSTTLDRGKRRLDGSLEFQLKQWENMEGKSAAEALIKACREEVISKVKT